MLGREPKDFDVATNARPEEVKTLFRNCVLVGRRFLLAHIRYGREVVEVATFRAGTREAEEEGMEGEEEETLQDTSSGRILRDNVYGTLEEDAFRRDFTINALYYNIADFSVVDYVDGMADLQAGVLRLIGDPEQRYREDPVRMLRAVRFAAKLGFRIHPTSEAPLRELGHLLSGVPPARLFEEVLKLFHGGAALPTFELLRHYGLFAHLFPQTEEALAIEQGDYPQLLLARALGNTDARINGGKTVTPAFLYAALLWPAVRVQAERAQRDGVPLLTAWNEAAYAALSHQIRHVAIPKRFSIPMREIWDMQWRLPRIRGKRPYLLLEHPRFRAAYDFLLLRAEAGEPLQELAEWWTAFQQVEPETREHMIETAPAPSTLTKKRRRRRKSTASAGHTTGARDL